MKHFRLAVIVLFATNVPVWSEQPVTNQSGGVLTIVGMPASNSSLFSAKKVVILYGNKFRFDLGPQTTQAPIGGAALPGALGPSAADIAKLPSAIASAPSQPPAPTPAEHAAAPPISIPDYPEACDQSDTKVTWPTGGPAQAERITKCWNGIRADIETDQARLSDLRRRINTTIRSAAAEQRCYSQKIWSLRQPSLTPDQAANLIQFAGANATAGNSLGCYQPNADQWPLDDADQLGIHLTKLQQALADLTTAIGYSNWANSTVIQSANSALVKQVGDFIAEANSYSTGTAASGGSSAIAQTYSDFQTVVSNNKQWRAQLSNLSSLSSLEIDIAIDPCREWYGKGRIDTIKLHAVDLSSSAGASQDIPLATNTCNPRTIASSGIGVSFLSNPVFAFVPADNTGAQVIGKTATNNAAPLYSVLYNVQLGYLKHGVELFASPGVGLTSTSNSTNADFLGGISMSFARRVLFITPAIDFGRRDQLAPGFTINTPKGSLTSVPTQSHWPVGFMLSISFGIGPS
jgi:hypothetical protein